MNNYLITYFKVVGDFHFEDFLNDVPVNPSRIITYDGKRFELHLGYFESQDRDLINSFEQTLSPLYDYLDKLIEWKDKGAYYKLEVETNMESLKKEFTIIPFKMAHFLHYTHAYNDDFPVW